MTEEDPLKMRSMFSRPRTPTHRRSTSGNFQLREVRSKNTLLPKEISTRKKNSRKKTTADEVEIAEGKTEELYKIRSKIGEGGVGDVYRAFDKNLNLEVALKRVPAGVSSHLQDKVARISEMSADLPPWLCN